ncbi:hypothetical protein JMJ55_26020 [Belnapia sp. T6]|uniref:Uncharacterized protein n=1 Tax=Belnapia mucosa TaxID=2804532 RepID=A0ABS1VAW6_9PROT|nr:hypothetical protein [Belnapia mucosa]MBL6458793.1 hypothetical protein [Belnapia mucosa]
MARGWWVLGPALVLGMAAFAQPASAPSRTGMPPLQVEPGDVWSDVRAWDEQARRRLGRNAAPANLMPSTPGTAEPASRPPRQAPAPNRRRPARAQN